MKNRTYHRKLVMIFAIIAAVVSITVIATVFLIESNMRSSVLHARESLEEVSSHAAESSIMEASGTIDTLASDSALASWASSRTGSAEYYFGALQIYKEIRRLSPVNGMYSYEISVTSADPEAFVITQDGTRGRRSFFSSLGIEGLSSMPLSPGTYAGRSEDGLVVILSRVCEGSSVFFIVEFPSELFSVPDDSGIDVTVLDEARNTVVSGTGYGSLMIHGSMIDDIDIGISENGGYAFRKVSFPYFRFSIVYSHYAGFMVPMIVFALIIPLILILSIAISYMLQKNLYEPVKTAYESARAEDDEASGNEFDAIISRCREADSLSRRLGEMFEELHLASDMQKYRAYIFGSDSPLRAEDDDKSFFALAIVIDDDDMSEMSVSHLLQVYSMVSRVKHLHFILMDDGTGTLIYKSSEEEGCYPFLYRCLKEYTAIDEFSSMQAAIVPASRGWESIHGSYRKAREIIGCRYQMRDKAILTQNDISVRTDTMHYPISDERKLINAALAASPDTMAIFDGIVAENHERMMGEGEYRQLASALASTVLRILQETKEDESCILSLRSLADGSDAGRIIDGLRSILSGYISRKRMEDDAKYSTTVALMKEYIQKHYAEPIMLIDLSEEFNLSPKYCSEIFNRLSGDTFKNYLNRSRVNAAQRMLDETPEIRISDLALRVGFSSSNTFIRVFDKYMGVTPKQYAESVMKRNSL